MVYLGLTLSVVFVISLVFILYGFHIKEKVNLNFCVTPSEPEHNNALDKNSKESDWDEIEKLVISVRKRVIKRASEANDIGAMSEAFDKGCDEMSLVKKLKTLSLEYVGSEIITEGLVTDDANQNEPGVTYLSDYR